MSDVEPTQKEPKELREALDRSEARADAAETKFRVLQATVTFGEAGLTPKHAELFLNSNPDVDVTAENAEKFAKEYGLTPAEKPADPPPETPPVDPGAGLAGLGEAAGSATAGSAPAAAPVMSAEDFSSLLETNPQEAAKAYVEGRAPRNKDNVQAKELVQKGIIDH